MIGRLAGSVLTVLAVPAVIIAAGLTALLPGAGGGASSAAGCTTDTARTSSTGGAHPAGLTREQTTNARIIVAVATQMKLPPRAAVIAVATALQESGLRNLPGGDRDSIGLFQQRPSQGWGTPAQLHDPAYAARAFYRRLERVPDWQHRPLTEAAQAVQGSATPNAFAAHETRARTIVTALANTTCAGDRAGKRAVAWALTQRGKPYVWGAEGPNTYDCSGLTMRAWQHAGTHIPRTTYDQWKIGRPVPRNQLHPGDLVFYHPGPRGPEHVGLYLNHGRMIEAPHTGAVVRVSPINRPGYAGARRPATR